jgi:PhnB protein
MKAILPYLRFDGNCREAMTFYKRCFEGELQMMRYRDAQGIEYGDAGDRIIHAAMRKEPVVLMAADGLPGGNFRPGNSVHLIIESDDVAEAERVFAALSVNATITMPLQQTFWAERYGELTDQFGVSWMFNVGKPAETEA